MKGYRKAKVYKGILPLFLAFVLMFTSIIPVSATASNGASTVAEGNAGVTVTEGKEIFSTDFESGVSAFTAPETEKGEITAATDDETHGKVMKLTRKGTESWWIYHANGLAAETSNTSVVYEFEVKLLRDNADFTFMLVGNNGSNKYNSPVKINSGTLVGNSNGSNISETLSTGSWYRVSVVYDYNAKLRSVYLDGEQVGNAHEFEADFVNADQVTQMRLLSTSTTLTAGDDFLIDNVKIYEGTKPIVDESGSEEEGNTPGVTVTEGKEIFSTDFESGVSAFTAPETEKGEITAATDDETHGKVMKLTRKGTESWWIYHANGLAAETSNTSVVYEFEVKLLRDNADFTFMLVGSADSSSKYNSPVKINSGTLEGNSSGSNISETLSKGSWYRVSVVYDYNAKLRSVYLDGEQVGNAHEFEADFVNADQVTQMRLLSTSATLTAGDDFLIDNVKVYEGTKPIVDESGSEEEGNTPGVTVTEGKEIFKTGFEIGGTSFEAPLPEAGTIAKVQDDEAHGTVMKYTRISTTDGYFMYYAGANLAAETSNTSVVYEFDVKLLKDKGSFGFMLRGTASDSSTKNNWPVYINDGVLVGNGANISETLGTGTWHTISVVYDYNSKQRSIYLDGEQVGNVHEFEADFVNADQVNQIRLCSNVNATSEAGDEFMIDNVRVYEGTKPFEFEDEDMTKPEVSVTEGLKIFEADFEERNPFRPIIDNVASGTINEENVTDGHGNVISFHRTGDGEYFMYYQSVAADTAYTSVVYEYDVKLLGEDASYYFLLRAETNDGTRFSFPSRVESGMLQDGNYASLQELEVGTWYTVSVVYDYASWVRRVYVNGEQVGSDIAIDSSFVTADLVSQVRITSKTPEEYTTGTADFMIDNVRVYEGTKPFEGELVEKEVNIEIDESKSIFNEVRYNTAKFDTMLSGYIALHTRSGMVYKEGTKTKLVTMPVKNGNGYSVVLDEICAALGFEYHVDGSQATVNGKTIAVREDGGKSWVDAEELLATYGTVSIDTNDKIKSSGMMIAGADTFDWPSIEYVVEDINRDRSELQDLNDYLFFERPSAKKIVEVYAASGKADVHPRLQATAEDFVRIKEEVKTDAVKNAWYKQLIETADNLVEINNTPVSYTLSGGRLLDVSADVKGKMYALGMAYQLTGDAKYAQRAWLDLQAVSEFKDWDPTNNLDYAIMCAAVAIGYDWMYYGLTEEQRETIEEAMYKNGFAVACNAFESSNGYWSGYHLVQNNHNAVTNGGMLMSALAFMDVYPEVASHITANTIRGLDIICVEYGKAGAWKEGPGYWEFATRYITQAFSSMETVLGTCFGLDICEGLDTTANFVLNLQSDVGSFNYGDTSVTAIYFPLMYYLSNKYSDESVTSAVLELGEGKTSGCEDLVLSLLWYDTDIKADTIEMELDAEYDEVVTLRDKWTNGVTTFVGIHGGANQQVHQQIDAGTFVYDYAGIRWAKELGKTPYNTVASSRYQTDGTRWLLYRSLAESHNLFVINPEDGDPGQIVNSTAIVNLVESKAKGSIATVDLTKNYAKNAFSAIRGFFFTDDRTSLVVRDEITLKEDNSEIYWFMQTDADIEYAADGKSAILSQLGKQVKVEFITSGNGTAELLKDVVSTRELLGSTSPIVADVVADENYYDVEDADVNRIAIKLSGASGTVAITVKLTPIGVSSTPISDYNKSISEWMVPDGEIVQKPQIQSVVMNGRALKFDETNQAIFLCVEGKDTVVPEPVVTVDETKFIYEVQNAETTDGGTTTITVRDKENSDVYATYTILIEQIPVPMSFEGMTSLQVVSAEASDEPERTTAGHVAWKTVDNNLDTRWTSMGMGNWLLLELEEKSTVDNMMILFKNGHLRNTYFNVEVSTDGEDFQMVFDGQSAGTALGSAEAFEQIALGGVEAKYIRINCNGNSVQGTVAGWNNIGEVVFTGTVTVVEPTPTPTVTPTPTPVITPTPSAAPSEEPTPTPTPSAEPTTFPTPVVVEIVADKTDESYTLDTNGTVSIYCTGELDEFEKVEVDGVEVDKSNYSLEEGSTILTFKTSYLETLAVGDHTVKMIYSGGSNVSTTLTVNKKVEEGGNNEGGTTESSNVDSGNNEDTTATSDVAVATQTGDDSNITLWCVLFIVALSGVTVMLMIYRKKSRKMM